MSSPSRPSDALSEREEAAPAPDATKLVTPDSSTGEDQDRDGGDVPQAASEAKPDAHEGVLKDVDGVKDAPPLPNEAIPDGPPLPKEPVPDGPPLPNEPVPEPEDDGWDCQWDPNTQAWFFANRFTGKTQWDNPRVPTASAAATPAATTSASGPRPPPTETPATGGYNPAIHGDYDPNAWYAQGNQEEAEAGSSAAATADVYTVTATFNRFTGQFQTGDAGPERHTDEAKSRRQMNAFFDVDAAANAHDGRSLKAERSGKKPTKSELKAFKEKRRVKKEEKRRAWLRD